MTADKSSLARNPVRSVAPTVALTRVSLRAVARALGVVEHASCPYIRYAGGELSVCGAPRQRGRTYCPDCYRRSLNVGSRA